MFDKLLHYKLLTEGLEGEGVITQQRAALAKGGKGGGHHDRGAGAN